MQTVSHVGENFTASVIVPSTIQEEYANFTVTLENNYGDTIILARDNSAYSNQFLDNVFVDNIAPTISLDGSYQYYLVQNRSINTIPTVTVTDGDPKYPKKLEDRHTITTSNDLNTSKIGSTACIFGIHCRIITMVTLNTRTYALVFKSLLVVIVYLSSSFFGYFGSPSVTVTVGIVFMLRFCTR